MRASLDGALSSALSRSSHRQPSVSSAPSRSLDSSGVFSPHFLLHGLLHTLRKFLFRLAPAASSSEPESLYLDIQRVTNRRSIQSCDKSQQSSSRLCARKLLRLDLLAVCATCVSAVKNRKNPVPTKTQNLEH